MSGNGKDSSTRKKIDTPKLNTIMYKVQMLGDLGIVLLKVKPVSGLS
jgi:hypothetical protein